MLAARALVILWMLHGACALGAPGPPPDPGRGESYDGRSHAPTLGDDLRLVPRLVLAPLRWLWKGLSYPARWLGNAEEKYKLMDHLYELLTSDDGQVGVRPEFSFISGYT